MKYVALLLVLSFFPLLNLLTPGLPVTHDGQDHVARIANFYQSLSEGNPVPRWAGNLNWGYGHPVVMFLYPLPSYLASFFHAIGFSLVDSTKLVFAVSYVASIWAMYFWLKTQWGTAAGLVGAVLYGFAPYRFVDLYVRGAIGEHLAFVFPPLVLLGLWKAAHQPSRFATFLTSLSTAGLILSHNALSLMFLPIIFSYGGYLYLKVAKNKRFYLLFSLYSLLLGFLLSAFFWLPAFFEGKYTLRDIVTKGEISDRFVPWQQFFVSSWNYGGGNQFTKELGLAQWLVVLGSMVLMFFSKKKPLGGLVAGSLLILAFVLFLMTEASSGVWSTITLLQKFQFPWRLLSLTTFITAFLGAVFVANISPKLKFGAVALLIFISLITTNNMWQAKAYQLKPEEFYAEVYEGTTDTGESSPIWSVRFMEQRSKAPLEIIEGVAAIEAGLRTTTERKYLIKAQTPTRLLENTLYFPGWQILVNGRPTAVEFQDPNFRGLMTFWVEPGEHRVRVAFGETKLRRLANTISLSGLTILIFTLGLLKYIKYDKKSRR